MIFPLSSERNPYMKKKILLFALIAICLSIAAYGTLAYFTYEDTATNVIVVGNVRIALHEWKLTDGGEKAPFEGSVDVMPGVSVSKIVEVENTGKNAAWIRISVAKAVELAAGRQGEVDLSLIKLDLNTEYWTEQDGYYYYNEALQPGQITKPLFTQISFDCSMGNLYQQSKATMTVQAQAVKVANNGATVFEAAGWPEN
jgi:predicted ribosomally synthesized peptide with SipW-like signal peptide